MALKPQQVAPELLHKVTKALGITALDQWYYVSQYAATRAIGTRALSKFGGSLASFLHNAYPQHQFDEEKLKSTRNLEKDQKFIEIIIRKLFPNTEIHTKAKKAVGIINPETEAYLEIDFWIPSLQLGIEYQDKHHYGYQWYANDALENYQKRDEIKKDTMSKLGYTLITIGYWWDKSIESVVATIRKFRPDLLRNYEDVSADPIPSDPPPGYITAPAVIPGVAGIMGAFVPKSNFNPTNWYAGEKHDGIRGVYNPELRKMFSRTGNELPVLCALLKDIPNMLIEGEITAGRGNYNRTTALSNHTFQDKVNWPMFRFVVFDIPDAEVGNYTQRYSAITRGMLSRAFIFAQSEFRVLVVNKDHLKMLVDSIISDAGEGVIAQKDVPYEYGRAKGLAKIKVRRDADAQVLHINELSCTCKLVSGITAEIVFSDSFDPSGLQTGDIISYYHNGYSQRGLPIRGEIYKVRYDITWKSLFDGQGHKVAKRRSIKEAIGGNSLVARNTVKNRKGHWNKSANVRAFFDEFASGAGFDPLVAENWYPVRYRSLYKAGGASLLNVYTFNVKKALSYAYPELLFDESRFRPRVTKGHWNIVPNARAIFDEFAQIAGFEPLVPENWYSVRNRGLKQVGGIGLLRYFKSLKKALTFAYPELKFEDRFRYQYKPTVKRGHWNKPTNVRAFFDEFARTNGFDPLVPENWYSVKYNALRNAGGSSVLFVHKFNVKKALASAYPELDFATEFKPRATKGHWNNAATVRAFLDEFARTAGFDPLVVENWYSIKAITVKQAGGSGLLRYFKLMRKALTFAYPEMKFEKYKRNMQKTQLS